MRVIALLLLCFLLASCQASGTHKGASVSANIFSLEF
jgi:predicted small secreted protein